MNTAEKIYSASTSEGEAKPRLAERLARRIEDDIAFRNFEAGQPMGSLDELCTRYAAGRAAVREGIGLLERRGLGRLRPGPCGGFIVEQPGAEIIGGELANYFRLVNITAQHLCDAREAVDAMYATMAADGGSAFSLGWESSAPKDLNWQLNLRTELARQSGDCVLPLFTSCLNILTREFAKDSTPAHNRSPAGNELPPNWVDHLPAPGTKLSLPVIEAERHADDRTLANFVARKIAAEILSDSPCGKKLGSEWELCDRFSVSRATLRQAIRQLEDMGLVECRRGRGNGLVAKDTRGTGGIRLVIAFLISHQMDPQVAGALLFQLNRYIPALAVHRASDAERALLQKQLTKVRNSRTLDRYDLLRLVQSVSEMADSPIIDFFSRCLVAYEARFHPFLTLRLHCSLQSEYFDLLQSLLDRAKADGAAPLEWAKKEASKVMMEMSRKRPL